MTQYTILDKIIAWKRDEIAHHKRARPIEAVRAEIGLSPLPRDLAAALRAPGVSLIAEVKRASPSKGLLRHNLDAVALAQEYEANGAAAISVLTDQHFFQSELGHLQAVRQNVDLPVLRKDFIFDPYQVYEARAHGADALLLIVAILSDGLLAELLALTHELGMTALVEVHNEEELTRALRLRPRVVGINNRNLHDFSVDLATFGRLRPLLTDATVAVSESGVHTAADVRHLAEMGADAVLVGEALVTAPDVAAKVRELAAGGVP